MNAKNKMKINLCKTKRVFRGFCRTEEGNEFITLHGETIKGKWVYGAPLTKWDPYMPGISQTFIISDNNKNRNKRRIFSRTC